MKKRLDPRAKAAWERNDKLRSYHKMLLKYVSGEDVDLDKATFLAMVRDRIDDDLRAAEKFNGRATPPQRGNKDEKST